MNEHHSSPLEERLRFEATRFHRATASPAAAKLLMENRRRQRQRSVMTSSGLAVASMMLLAAVLLSLPRAMNATALRGSVEPGEAVNVVGAETGASQHQSQSDAKSQSADSVTSSGAHDEPHAETARTKALRVRAIPLLLVRENKSGQREVVRALLVPRKETTVRYENLSSGEQRALRALLGKNRIPKQNAI